MSKNKRIERKGKIQLIDASSIYHKLRKSLGDKKNEFTPEDRAIITQLYANFVENDYVKIFDNTEFLYKEYTIMQPLQRSYKISTESINRMLEQGVLDSLWDDAKVASYEEKGTTITVKEKAHYEKLKTTKPLYDSILKSLIFAKSNRTYLSPDTFRPVLQKAFED